MDTGSLQGRAMRGRRLLLATLAAALFTCALCGTASAGLRPTLTVSGNQLMAGGAKAQLRGVNWTYFVDNCDYSEPEPNVANAISEMQTWKVNTVRLAFDPYCWLGVADPIFGGQVEPANTDAYPSAAAYQAAIEQRVSQFEAAGFWVDLDAYGVDAAPAQAYHTAWSQVAAAFKTDHRVLFDPVNEVGMYGGDYLGAGNVATYRNGYSPSHPASYNKYDYTSDPSTDAWTCWLKGCTVNSRYGGYFASVGLNTLVQAIRNAGAKTQPITVGSLGYNTDFDQWTSVLPADKSKSIVADTHRYDFIDVDDNGSSPGNGAGDASFDSFLRGTIVPLAATVPVFFGELGEINCDTTQTNDYTAYALRDINLVNTANGTKIGALGYEWRAPQGGFACPTGAYASGGPLLLESNDGTPSKGEGAAFMHWMLQLGG